MSILIADFDYKRGLRRHLLANDITYDNLNGLITFNDETAALQLIAAYNPLQTVRREAKTRVKLEFSVRVNELYPYIAPDMEEAMVFYEDKVEGYNLVKPAARNPITGKFLQLKELYDTAKAKIVEVNSMNDWQAIEAYDATVGW